MILQFRHEGRIARMNRKTFDENPYLPTMGASRDWAEGWKQADKAYENYLKNGQSEYCPHCGQEINYD